ncbi:MAG TPA: HEAT repeat domain-containing protein [Sedimentisphaerales bacterium]|nr:HEAT repeat domain-containing protein [Sedimentisphaerales bacterium]
MIIKKRYSIWFVILIIVAMSAGTIAQDQPAADVKQRDLIAVLQSDAPKSEKAIACKKLVIYGTEQCVPALAPLLEDKELASWARIALEAIPGPAADTALRDASSELKGRLLVGVINSIGMRGDAKAVDILANKLNDDDINVASAAAVALGHIGGEKAAKALTKALAIAPASVRSAVAEGCILCAERFLAQDRTAEAVKLYDTVRKADVPDQRHLEAIRGAILARQSAGLPLLIEQLRSEDKKRLGIGLRTARELPGRNVTEALAVELDRLSPDRRPLLLLALADRSDSAVLPIVHKTAQSSSKDLRITAINILIRLGDVSCVPVLLEAATEDDAKLKQAAMETLVRLPGKDVDADILARLPQAGGKLQQVLIELAGQRQISQALPAVVLSLHDVDAETRGAAIRTISIIGQDQQTADLVKLLQNTKNSSERSDIRKALLAISGRCGAKCIPHLKPLTQSRDNELHMIGLRALAIIGGSDALMAVKSAIEKAEPPAQDEAVRILSNWPYNWPEDTEAGQALLMLATSAKKIPHQVLGLRGYLQYIRGNKKLSNERKVARIKDILSHIKRPEEKRQAIAVLGEVPSASALELLTMLAEDPAVVEEAYSAMVQIAANDIRGISMDQRRQVLQTVAEKSRNDGTRQRARKTLSGLR